MFRKVDFLEKSLDDHAPYAGEDRIAEIRRLAEDLGSLRVLHVNSTSYGGGVAELLYTIVPLMRDAGLDAEWHVIDGAPDQFFDITKKIHNSLQGANTPLSDGEWRLYEDINRKLAEAFPRGPWDIVVIHDPQPLAVLTFLDSLSESDRPVVGRWFWRCHIDLSTPLEETWQKLWPYVNAYDGAIVTSRQYARDEMTLPVAEITPSTDPTSPKNFPIPEGEARKMMGSFGVDPARPIIVQVSRFDPWKDPFGVVEAYRMLKGKWPELQLAMVGSIAADDPEGIGILAHLKEEAAGDRNIHVLSNEDGVGAREVAAFQQCADVVIQKSIREGFGLTITEAMWKRRPVVAGNATGCKIQITDGMDGFIVGTTQQCAERIDEILSDPDLGARLGDAARETVRRRFLSTQHVANYLNLFAGCQ